MLKYSHVISRKEVILKGGPLIILLKLNYFEVQSLSKFLSSAPLITLSHDSADNSFAVFCGLFLFVANGCETNSLPGLAVRQKVARSLSAFSAKLQATDKIFKKPGTWIADSSASAEAKAAKKLAMRFLRESIASSEPMVQQWKLHCSPAPWLFLARRCSFGQTSQPSRPRSQPSSDRQTENTSPKFQSKDSNKFR